MSGVTRPELGAGMPDLGDTFLQVSLATTRRLCEQGQFAAQTIGALNIEVSRFLTNRVGRNGETIGRLVKCENFPDAFAIQAHFPDAFAIQAGFRTLLTTT